MHDATAVLHDTIDSARDVVHETVATVKDAVASTGDMVKSSVASVKESFNLPLQIQWHPWTAVGAAAAAGFALGTMMESRHHGSALHGTSSASSSTHAFKSSFESPPQSSPAADSHHGGGGVPEAIVKHLEPLKGFAIGAAMSVVRNLLGKGLHEDWSKPLFEAIDDITRELGGRPVAKPANEKRGS